MSVELPTKKAVLEDEITSAFELIGTVSQIVMNKCVDLCSTYDIDAEQLSDTWAAFTLSHRNNEDITIDGLQLMERKELKRKGFTPKKATATPKSKKFKDNSDDFEVVEESNIMEDHSKQVPKAIINTPKRVNKNVQLGFAADDTLISHSPISQAIPFSKREDAGKIVLTVGTGATYYPCTKPVEIKQFLDVESRLSNDRKYMFTNLKNKAASLSRVAQLAGSSIMVHNKLVKTVITKDKHMPDVLLYGRICCDCDGKLNSVSTIFETPSSAESNSVSLLVDFTSLRQYSIFPGQVVAIHGNILNGTKLHALNITTSSFTKPNVSEEFTESLQIITASGPFTIKDNLNYEPLGELIEYVLEKMPHVLILMGPFLDEEHNNVKDGSMTDEYDSFFANIIESIMTPLADKNIQVVLVASHKDIHHQVVYPTPPYELHHKYSNLMCVPDPCLLNINGVIVGMTTADILFHIGRQELSRVSKKDTTKMIWGIPNNKMFSAIGGDRITRLSQHVLDQLCFYPLYPPDESMSIDHGMLEKYGLLNVVPNVLIMPSTLRYFAKEVKGCTVINPERLVKGSTGGTFARFQVNKKNGLSVSCEIIRI